MKKPRNHAEETARRTRAVYTCAQCGNTFTRLAGRKLKFCSNKCLALDAWRRRKNGELGAQTKKTSAKTPTDKRIKKLLLDLISLTSSRSGTALSKLAGEAEEIVNEKGWRS